ncbi:DUF2989 domain-containing protein [Shewanella youngdeokensis]|uniref:DUF2989 domain-containing protein n=1 Tax=Shewanella youngdeokensis TaxID=2999068 RepID=A0ABZ0K368_9GAMM|nr:DUF2989 domain-containing protein [Shewanella sp. DAU334]
MNIKIVMITSFTIITALLGLFGCKPSSNTKEICNNNPEICADLHEDSWCIFEKDDLIRSREQITHSIKPSGKQLFELLLQLEGYNKCIELAAGVKHIIHTERSNDRARAYGLSSQSLTQLQENTKNSLDPHLAYYHWSRFNDHQSAMVLFAAERNGQVDDVRIKAQIAIHFLKSNSLKSKRLFAEAFAESNTTTFDPDWLLALAKLYAYEDRPEMNYLLSKTNIIMTQAKFAENQMLALLKGDKAQQQKLDKKAKVLADELRSGKYLESQLRIVLEQDLKQRKN